MADVICLGELLIDFAPTVMPTSLEDAPAFMGKVDEHPFGRFLADTLPPPASTSSPCSSPPRPAPPALVTTERGAIPAMPTPEKVQRLLSGQPNR